MAGRQGDSTIADQDTITVTPTPLHVLTYDKTTEKMKITFAAGTPTPTCSSGKFRFVTGSNPSIIHDQEITTLPTSTRVFDVTNMKKWVAGGITTLTALEISELETSLVTDNTAAFVCTNDVTTLTGSVTTTVSIVTGTITATDVMALSFTRNAGSDFFVGLLDSDCESGSCVGNLKLTVMKADNSVSCTQDIAFSGSYPYMMDFIDSSFACSSGTPTEMTTFVDTDKNYIAFAQHLDASSAILKQMALPALTVSIPSKMVNLEVDTAL